MEKTNKAKVSVLMPAYNAENYIIAAISSILSQEFTDFNLIVLNDGSTDNTAKIINNFAVIDQRIQVLSNADKTGILAARDKLLDAVNTEYFCWMDADDIVMPDRLKLQISYLEANPGITGVSGYWRRLGDTKKIKSYQDPDELNAAILVSNPFLNALLMLRSKDVMPTSFRFTDCGVKSASDYAFIIYLNQLGCKFFVLPKVLYLYRQHALQESTANAKVQRHSLKLLMLRQFEYYGIKVPEFAQDAIRTFSREKVDISQINAIAEAYKQLIQINKINGIYKQNYLYKHLGISLKRMCREHRFKGILLYVKHFGFWQLIHGRAFGLAFINDCLRSSQNQ